MASTVYLISGANRGIGLGLVNVLVQRPNVVVFAGVRNPAKADQLEALRTQYPDKLYIVKITSADRADNLAAVDKIKEITGRLDVVIANAGISKVYASILDTPEEEIREHHEVNVVGPVVLFKAVWPLLKQSPKPIFAIISSVGGSLSVGAPLPLKNVAYGMSKAAVNYFAIKLHVEHPELIVLVLHPGFVATEMAEFAVTVERFFDSMTPISVETSVQGLIKQLDDAKRPEDGVKLIGYDGAVIPW